jgi:hypothetical protein
MRFLLVSFLAAAPIAATLAADTPTLTGKWQVHTSIAGTEVDDLCTFTQKENALTGNCSSDRGTFELSGSVSGQKVSWTYKSEYNGTPITVAFAGAVNAENKITGSVNVPEFGAEGEFQAVQPKQ